MSDRFDEIPAWPMPESLPGGLGEPVAEPAEPEELEVLAEPALEEEAEEIEEAAGEPALTAAPEPIEDEVPEADEAEEEPPELRSTEHAEGVFFVPDGYSVLEGAPNGSRRSVAVVVSRFNAEVTNRLLGRTLDALEEGGVSRDAIVVMPVPGAFELPLAAMALAKTRRYACIVALGCVIRGETPHFDYVASEAASGLQLAAIETGVPVAFGVLTCETREQADARIDRGAEAARTALEMADLFAQLRATAAAAR